MYIQTHIVSEPVRLEETGYSVSDHGVEIPLDQAERREPLKHLPCSRDVHITVSGARSCEFECEVVAVADDLVYLPLPGGELS